jgi:hypothetical protein
VSYLRFLLILVFIFSNNFLFADECKNFEDKVLAIPIPEVGMVTDGQQPKFDVGLFFHQDYDYEQDKILIRRDENNHPILKFSFVQRDIASKTPIININNNDSSLLSDNEILDLISKEEINISTSTNEYKINAIEYDLYIFDLEYFNINAIDEIKTKEGEFQIDYTFQVSNERPDWIEPGREIGNNTICSLAELHESTRIFSPIDDVDFLTQIGLDQDKVTVYYDQIYYSETDKTFSTGTFAGVARIKSDFDLKKFPFDEQELKMEFYPPYSIEYNDDKNYPKPFVTLFQSRSNVYLDIEKYKNNNYLKEWTVIETKVENYIKREKTTSNFEKDKIVELIEDRINVGLIVKRNINYFIFKIIIPVFLILAISWSVMWIPPNQVESRLTTSIVSLLALIAYNFVFNEDIPKLSYLTSLDRYILLSYLFCAIPTFLTIYFSRITKKDYKIALEINKKSRLIGIIIYLISAAVIFSF